MSVGESKSVPPSTKLMISGSVLALALGAGFVTPAEAGLIVEQLGSHTVAPGESFNFGPNGDEFTFTNFGSIFFGFTEVGLQGNNTISSDNMVAVIPASTELIEFAHGSQVDASDTFDVSGTDVIKNQTVFYGLQSIPNDVVTSLDEDPFGFLELHIGGDNNVILDEFALESVPDAPAPIPTPEPGTIGLFMGGAAVLAARKRKKDKARAAL